MRNRRGIPSHFFLVVSLAFSLASLPAAFAEDEAAKAALFARPTSKHCLAAFSVLSAAVVIGALVTPIGHKAIRYALNQWQYYEDRPKLAAKHDLTDESLITDTFANERFFSEEQIKIAALQEALDATVKLGGATGVLVSAEGHVLTAAHVITKDADKKPIIPATYFRGRRMDLTGAEVVQEDSSFVLLRIPSLAGENPIRIARGQKDQKGFRVFAVGYPAVFSGRKMVSTGRAWIESPGQTDKTELQSNAIVRVGNSGGPFVNEDGELVGIATHTFTRQYPGGYREDVSIAANLERILKFLDPGEKNPETAGHRESLAGIFPEK